MVDLTGVKACFLWGAGYLGNMVAMGALALTVVGVVPLTP